jgi:hypothetical protein
MPSADTSNANAVHQNDDVIIAGTGSTDMQPESDTMCKSFPSNFDELSFCVESEAH